MNFGSFKNDVTNKLITSKSYAGYLNIHGNHVTANNPTNNNVFFFVSDLKIVYYNPY